MVRKDLAVQPKAEIVPLCEVSHVARVGAGDFDSPEERNQRRGASDCSGVGTVLGRRFRTEDHAPRHESGKYRRNDGSGVDQVRGRMRTAR